MVFKKNYNRDEDDDTPTDIDEVADVSGEETEDEYVVEKIIDHRTIKGVTQYYLKWKGYPEEDNTWENESDVFAKELIEKYWERKKKNSKSKEKIDKVNKVKKKQTMITNNQVNIRKRKLSDSSFTEKPDFSLLENFPPTNLTNWEEAVDDVETVERNPENSGLLIYLNWKNGHRTRHPSSIANLMCPQKIIRFYEEHLKFKDPDEELFD